MRLINTAPPTTLTPPVLNRELSALCLLHRRMTELAGAGDPSGYYDRALAEIELRQSALRDECKRRTGDPGALRMPLAKSLPPALRRQKRATP